MHCIVNNMFPLTSDSEGDNTATVIGAIVGGVLGTLLILSVTVSMIIIVTCLLRNHAIQAAAAESTLYEQTH